MALRAVRRDTVPDHGKARVVDQCVDGLQRYLRAWEDYAVAAPASAAGVPDPAAE